MQLGDLLVEVRTSSLERVGSILGKHLRLDAETIFNGVGTWTITIATSHPLADALAAPGAGIVVTDLSTSKVLFSGPTVAPEEAHTVDDIAGTITIQGVTDEIILDDALAWPDPLNGDVTTQAVAYDTRTGFAEALIHQFVQANIGINGSAARRNLRLLPSFDTYTLGQEVTIQTRFDKLLTLCQNIAKPDGLGFRVVQIGAQLRLETWKPNDNSRMVRLSLDNNGISSARISSAAPGSTRAIVAGNGGTTTRLFVEATTPDSLAAEQEWGRRIERFVDDSSTRNIDDLARAGEEALAEDGFTGTNARFEPTESFRGTFGVDWGIGDKVAIETGAKTFVSPVTTVIFKADEDGLRIGATLGDPTAFNAYQRLNDMVAATQEQVKQGQKDDLPAGQRVYRQPEPPDEATQGPFQVGYVWFDTDDGNKIHFWDGTAWNDAHDTSIDDALEAADDAAAAATAAASQATVALTAANGKSKVTYSLSGPGATANSAGDIWFQRDLSGTIVAQWEGQGGTSWATRTLNNAVIANLDAGKLIAGTAFVNALTVKTLFTLGDAATNGIIQSYNYASASTGVYLDKNGIVAKGGTITAATLQTTTGGASGIKLTPTSFVAYAAGFPTFMIDASTGNVTMKGSLTAGSDIDGATLTGSTVTGGTVQTSTGATAGIKLKSDGSFTAYQSSGAIGVRIVNGFMSINTSLLVPTLTVSNTLDVSNAASFYGGVYVNSGGINITGSSSFFNGVNVGGLLNATGNVTAPKVFATSADTTTNAANARILSGGQIAISTASAAKYKENIRPLDEDELDPDLIVQVAPSAWTYRPEYCADTAEQWGAIADHADALGLTKFVEYHEETGEVENFRYDRWPMALQAVARNHHRRIAELEREIAELKAA